MIKLLNLGNGIHHAGNVIVGGIRSVHELKTFIAAASDHGAEQKLCAPSAVGGIHGQRRDASGQKTIAVVEEFLPGFSGLDTSLIKQFLIIVITDQLSLGRRCVYSAVTAVCGFPSLVVHGLPLRVSVNGIGQIHNQISLQCQIQQLIAAAVNHRRQLPGGNHDFDFIGIVGIARNIFHLNAVLTGIFGVEFFYQLGNNRSCRVGTDLKGGIFDHDFFAGSTVLTVGGLGR